MSTDTSSDTPVRPSGLRLREIATTIVKVRGTPTVVPRLDDKGREVELFSVDVPHDVEADGAEAIEQLLAAAREGPDAVAAFYATRHEAAMRAAEDAALADETASDPITRPTE